MMWRGNFPSLLVGPSSEHARPRRARSKYCFALNCPCNAGVHAVRLRVAERVPGRRAVAAVRRCSTRMCVSCAGAAAAYGKQSLTAAVSAPLVFAQCPDVHAHGRASLAQDCVLRNAPCAAHAGQGAIHARDCGGATRPADPAKVSHLVVFLENRKIRQWPIEARGVLSELGPAWLAAFTKYLQV
jgi:hypothetical protein